jgi:gliding motility-associated-like protein
MRAYLTFLFFYAFVSYGQKQNNTWIMGSSLGMEWNNQLGSLNSIPDPVGGVDRRHQLTSCISDPQTGRLLLYVDQTRVYNANFQPMANGELLTPNGDNISAVGLIPLANREYYVVVVSEENHLSFVRVDLKRQGGLGAVVGKLETLNVNTDKQFNAVRMPNGQGYWLITHLNSSNLFVVFPIFADGKIGQRVISEAGEITLPAGSYNNGELFTTTDGKRFIHIIADPPGSGGNPTLIQEFNFDKKCGIVTFKNRFKLSTNEPFEYSVFGAYSPNNNLLFISFESTAGGGRLVQYDLTAPNPQSTRTEIASTTEIIGDLQTAPDNKIYASSSIQRTFTSQISVIQNPNIKGLGCNFNQNSIELSRNPFLGNIGVERFPQLIHDIDTALLNSKTPNIQITQTCLGTPTLFRLTKASDLLADSFHWEFGDGSKVVSLEVNKLYPFVGKDTVSFVWYVCGRMNRLKDSLEITAIPTFSLGIDTTICYGAKISLSGPLNKDTYLWSTGNTGATIVVEKAGTYSLKVLSGNCPASDTITITNYNQLWTALDDEYFICEDEKELVKLDAGEKFEQYKWTPTGDTTQWIIVKDVGDYFVVVKDFRGCDGSDGTQVKRRCPVYAFFPNVFTPNNDGLNDVFALKGKDIEQLEIKVTNRWGAIIWQSKELNAQWDGNVDGKPAPTDVYMYTATYGGFVRKRWQTFATEGTVTLLR